jgi:AcrR family transcriptional regulator
LADTREKIKQAALTLFIEKGYDKTSIAAIESAAGLAPRTGGFYRHFPSKVDLAVEIGETSIIETRRDLGLDVLPLGDTRAELVLIAKGYLRAAERQAPLAGLIFEVRQLPRIQDLEKRVSEDLLEALMGWLKDKPLAQNKTDVELTALILTVFGGWLFFLSKRGSGIAPELTDERMLSGWADFWTHILDTAPPNGAQDPPGEGWV